MNRPIDVKVPPGVKISYCGEEIRGYVYVRRYGRLCPARVVWLMIRTAGEQDIAIRTY